jgi:leucyl/phenylalanyl-tRNA---protein transferase
MRSLFYVSPALLLNAYRTGVFPMAESADDPGLFWVDPERRGILPLHAFHVPRRLRRVVMQDRFEVRVDSNFAGTLAACAEAAENRPSTWINDQIVQLYKELHERDNAHSVECWQDDALVGGLYGVSIGGAFFGESMFSRVPDASKVALVHLVSLMRVGGYRLLDVQFVTSHLAQFGAIEVPRAEYRRLLAEALDYRCVFPRGLGAAGGAAGAGAGALAALQASNVTS